MDASGGEVRRINVVYFLSRMGKFDHPHLIRVHHLHRKGVRLRDVKRWMSDLRGKAMPDSFAWSYKRKYKSGYVWQDLLEDDHLITPVSDNEYVLKGSLITSTISPSNQDEIKRTVGIEGGESEGSGSDTTRTDEFRMEGSDRTVEETKGEDQTGRRKSYSSHVLKRLLTCRTVETNDAAMTRIKRGESDRLPVRVNGVDGSRRVLGTEGIHHQRPSNHESGGRKSRISEESEGLMRSVPAACKPVSMPKCSQCGKSFKPEKLVAHMKSCKGLKGSTKGEKTGVMAEATIPVMKVPSNKDAKAHQQAY